MTRRKPRPWVLAASMLLLYGGTAFSFPFMALFLTQRRELGAAKVGLFLAACQVASALGQSWGGLWADRWGSRNVMIAALAARTVLILALSRALQGGGFGLLVAVHLLYSLVGSAFEPASRIWIAERYRASERLDAFSFMRVPMNLGWAAGPAAAAFFPLDSFPRFFLVSAAAAAACALLTAFALEPGRRAADVPEPPPSSPMPPTDSPAPSTGEVAGRPAAVERRFAWFCVATAGISLVMSQLVVGLSLHATAYAGLTHRQVGWLFALNGLMVVALQTWATGRLAGSRLTSMMAGGSLLYAAGFAWVGAARGFGELAAAIAVVTLGEIVVSPALVALAANMAPAAERGRYLGVHGAAHQLGLALGPVAGGWGIQTLGPRDPALPWLGIAAVGAASAAAFYRLRASVSGSEDAEGLPAPASSS